MINVSRNVFAISDWSNSGNDDRIIITYSQFTQIGKAIDVISAEMYVVDAIAIRRNVNSFNDDFAGGNEYFF